MALPVTRVIFGKMLMNEQTSPLPANKELIRSTVSWLPQDRRSAAVVCERCRRRMGRSQRLQSSFLISATAALASSLPVPLGQEQGRDQ